GLVAIGLLSPVSLAAVGHQREAHHHPGDRHWIRAKPVACQSGRAYQASAGDGSFLWLRERLYHPRSGDSHASAGDREYADQPAGAAQRHAALYLLDGHGDWPNYFRVT